MSQPFLAEIRILPYTFAPVGWSLCQGQILPIAQYTAIFSLLGTMYGGNGTSNFALPDLQGRVVVGADPGGPGNYPQGGTGGTEGVTLTSQQIAAHNHTASAVSDAGNSYSPAGDVWSADAANRAKIYGASAPNVAMGPNALSPAGGGQAHNNMQPYIAMNYCIAMAGVFRPGVDHRTCRRTRLSRPLSGRRIRTTLSFCTPSTPPRGRMSWPTRGGTRLGSRPFSATSSGCRITTTGPTLKARSIWS